jgi:hypothetical protein
MFIFDIVESARDFILFFKTPEGTILQQVAFMSPLPFYFENKTNIAVSMRGLEHTVEPTELPLFKGSATKQVYKVTASINKPSQFNEIKFWMNKLKEPFLTLKTPVDAFWFAYNKNHQDPLSCDKWRELKIEVHETKYVLFFDDSDSTVINVLGTNFRAVGLLCEQIIRYDPDFIYCEDFISLLELMNGVNLHNRLSRLEGGCVSWDKEKGIINCPGRVCLTKYTSKECIFTMAKLTRVLPKFAIVSSKLVERSILNSQYTKFLFIKAPSLSASEILSNKSYAGGLHMDPQRGIYNKPDEFHACVDVISMYPSVLISNNICPTRCGVFPAIMLELINTRKKIKSEKTLANWDETQTAVKLYSNSIIGEFGRPSSVLYCVDVASAITAKGREVLVAVTSHISKTNKVVYGNTDSCFFKTNATTEEEALDETNIILQKINSEVLYGIIKIQLDFLTNFLVIIEKNNLFYKKNGQIIIKGWAAVNNSSPLFAIETAHLFIGCLSSNYTKQECWNFLNSRLVELNNITDPDMLKVKFKMSRSVDEYSSSMPAHIRAISQSLTPHQKFNTGDFVDIVYSKDKGPMLLCDFKSTDTKFDYDKYAEIVESPYRKIFEMMDGNVLDDGSNKKQKKTVREIKKTKLSIDSFFGY